MRVLRKRIVCTIGKGEIMIRFFDMFSGIGGFRAGLERTEGFKCVGHCEIDKYANNSYCSVFNTKDEVYFNDATKLNPKDITDFDLLCAGFPCQSFSVAGKRLGFDDARGTLFLEIARVLKEKRPKYFLLENVPGLLNHDKGKTFTVILCTLSDLGYGIEWQVLNSADFAVPQSRKRVYLVGYRDERCAGKILPFTDCNPQTLKQVIGGSQGQRAYDVNGLSSTLAANSGGQGGKTGLYIDLNADPEITALCRCIKARYNSGITKRRGENSGLIEGPMACLDPGRIKKRQNGRRFKSENEPMFTLTAQDRHGILDKFRVRKLMPKECLRLQGFPDEMIDKMLEITSDNQAYKQAGNAVTVNVVEA
ncbi:MAG: DNA (cytosine-5-)-methyltransferase, partial [Lachnospiraceae bacterium]|nr:DNA (cytosine-5-)-methyltransferase [Lachnospiraceae bacterium]